MARGGPLKIAIWRREASNWAAAQELVLEEGEWVELTLPTGEVVNVFVNGEGVRFETDDGRTVMMFR